jgi:hypothetical protein
MKQWLLKHYHIFHKHPDWYFFYLFLISFPLSVRKIIHFYPISGQYNEFTSISLYLSDLLLLATLIIWLAKLYNNILSSLSIALPPTKIISTNADILNKILSIPVKFRITNILNMFLVGVKCFIQAIKSPYIYLPLILCSLSFLSIICSEIQLVALFRSVKILEFTILYFFIIYNVLHVSHTATNETVKHSSPRGTFIYQTLWLIFVIGFIYAIIGIIQFALQHSIGLFWLKESHLAKTIPYVAKIAFLGKSYIRSYSLFPHPNVFGGFLVMAIVSGLYLRKIYNAGTNVSPQYKWQELLTTTSGTLTRLWNIYRSNIIIIILFTLILSLILTFSKSAWLGLTVALIYIYRINVPPQYKCSTPDSKNCSALAPLSKIVPRETISFFFKNRINWKPYRVIINRLLLILLILASASIIYLVESPNLSKSIDDRLFYLNPAINIISAQPLLGVGIGQFVPRMEQFSNTTLQNWQFQPVHDVYLLVWSELGFIGFLALIQILVIMFRNNCSTPLINVPPKVKNNLNCPASIYSSIHKVSTIYSTKNVPRGTNFNINCPVYLFITYLSGILLAFMVIMLLDHYFWDIQQGQIILWLSLGLIAGLKSHKSAS